MKLLSFFILISIFTGCTKNETEHQPVSLEFNVDSSLIGNSQKIEGIRIKFNPPLYWKQVSTEMSEKVMNRVRSEQNEMEQFIFKTKGFYLQDTTHSLLTIGIAESKNPNLAKNEVLYNYMKLVEKKFEEAQIKKGEFIKDDILITQYLIQKSNLVSFKLLFFDTNNKLIQMDYTTQKEFYPNEIKSIESSIGSIQLLN